MKTDREFIGSVYYKIAEQNKKYITPKKSRSPAGYISVAAAAVCMLCAVIIIPGLINPVLKDGAISGTAGTESEAAETEAVQHFRFEGISPDELCETYDLKYNVFYPDILTQTEDLNISMQTAISGVGLKIAYPSEWTYSNTYDTKINTDKLLYKLIPKQISLMEIADTLMIINDHLSMISGSEPDIITEHMKKSTIYYCVKYPDGPPTGELSDAELEIYYNQVIAYFFCELDSGYLLQFLLLSTKDNIEPDIMRYLAMFSTAEITEGDIHQFDINLPIDSYTLAMSSVPGLPFSINFDTGSKVFLNITTSRGTLLTWGDGDNWVVKPFVNGDEYGKPVTLYWSPIDSDGNFADGTQDEGIAAVITVTVYTPEKQEGRREITITSDGLYYYAHVSEFSYTG